MCDTNYLRVVVGGVKRDRLKSQNANGTCMLISHSYSLLVQPLTPDSVRRLTPELLRFRRFGELLAHCADELLSEGVAVVAAALAHDEEEEQH